MTQEKMFLTNQPPLPARCAVCYNDAKSNLHYVDFGMSLDDYGAVVICELCMVSAAKLIGYVPVEPVVDTAPLHNEIASLTKKVQALESLVRAYVSDSPVDLGALFGPSADVSLFEFLEAADVQPNSV